MYPCNPISAVFPYTGEMTHSNPVNGVPALFTCKMIEVLSEILHRRVSVWLVKPVKRTVLVSHCAINDPGLLTHSVDGAMYKTGSFSRTLLGTNSLTGCYSRQYSYADPICARDETHRQEEIDVLDKVV
jgi:hypothetical protein